WSLATPMTRPRFPFINPSMAVVLCGIALEDQRGVGAAEAEGVRQHCVYGGVVGALAHDRHVFKFGVEALDMGGLADAASRHHQEGIDRFLDAGSPTRMAGRRLGGGYLGRVAAEHPAYGSHFPGIPDWRRGAMRVDAMGWR